MVAWGRPDERLGVRIRGLCICAFGCDRGEATYGATGPGHVSSGHTAPCGLRTATGTHNHYVGHNSATYNDITSAARNHRDNDHDDHRDCGRHTG